MGKATRWLKGLLGMKKEKENNDKFSNYAEKKEKKRWSFARSGKVPVEEVVGMNIPVNIPVSSTDAAWIRSFMSESEKEQNKHAIAVAAATAAAADAAVAAAQAAVAVVRLTSHGRTGGGTTLLFSGGREKLAAIKIQTFFRGYLARKAHRALKGLVKLQALVRGYLVRKRTAATLHSMQALIRAQSAVRSQRARRSSISCDYRYPPEIRARRSIERFDHEFHSKRLSSVQYDNGFDDSPKIVEIDTYKPKSRSRRITNNNLMSDSFGGYDQNFNQQAVMMSSPLPFPFSGPAAVPARLSIPDCRNFQEFDWSFIGEECNRFAAASATAHSTPRFGNTRRTKIPVTPSKSVCGDSFFRPYSNCPSYMANTQSFNAKLRSHSAPKQRPEPGTGPGQKKRLSLNEIMASRSSFTGVRMQKPPRSQVQEELEF